MEKPNPLKVMREVRGFTLNDLSKRTGIDPASLCRFENGLRVPPAKLAVIVNVLSAEDDGAEAK